MVAKIKSGKSLKGALNYNERKVTQHKARLIAASGYPKDIAQMNFYDKLFRLTDLATRNERTKTNCLHISLNFPNGEALADELLERITQEYMTSLGFKNQPYLVYRHEDAGHPHIHIISTNIQADGQRISLHYIGQDRSEKARKEIEVKYNLIKAEGRQPEKPILKAIAADYGKDETKRAITNILGEVIRTYKFTSIPELNAALRQYHIAADQGSKDSRQYAHGGLVYWVLDAKGHKIGVPIKASSIYNKPTLKMLKQKFRLNETLRKTLKPQFIARINKALYQSASIAAFQKELQKQDAEVILRRNDEGHLYGVTFIDLQNKAVFNGSDLSKEFSANAMVARFAHIEIDKSQIHQHNQLITSITETVSANHRDIAEDISHILLGDEQNDMAAYNKIKRNKQKRQNI